MHFSFMLNFFVTQETLPCTCGGDTLQKNVILLDVYEWKTNKKIHVVH